MAFRYVSIAAKATNLENSRHSESGSDLQQKVCISLYGESRIIRDTNQKFVLLRYCNFYVLLRYFILALVC